MIKIRAFFLVMMLAVCTFAASPTMFTIDGSTSFERDRLTRMERSLNFTKVAMPDTWDVHIVPKEQFDISVAALKMNTYSAYTFLPLDQTYINEEYLVYASDSMIRHTMAHEAGHMICQCASESKANDIAWVIEQ